MVEWQKKIGEHLGSFTEGHFDLTDAINWKEEPRYSNSHWSSSRSGSGTGL